MADARTSTGPTLLGAVLHYRWLFVTVVVLFVAAGLGYALTRPIQYVATASLVIEDPRSSTLFGSLSTVSPTRYLVDQVAVLGSTAVAERAAEVVDLTIEEIFEGISLEASPEGNFIAISMKADDPLVAEQGANAIANAYEDVRRSEAIRSAASALEQLDEKINAINAELLEISRRVDALRSPSADVLDGQLDAAIDRLYGLLDIQLGRPLTAEETAELDSIFRQFQTFQLIASIESQNPELSILQREQTSSIDRRSDLKARRDGIEIDAELASQGVALFSPALGSVETGRDLGRTLAVALVLGGLAGTGLPYLLSLRLRGFTGRVQPEAILGAPLLAEVYDFREEGVTSNLPVREEPRSSAAESYRFAMTGIELQMASASREMTRAGESPRGSARILVVVSAKVGDGKTTTTANLALAAARRGISVLAIDADFGDQQLSEILDSEGTRPYPGLTDVVERGHPATGAVKSIDITDGSQVHLLSRGRVSITAPEFFRSAGTRAFFDAITDHYDLILVDVPPLLQVAYASNISRMADMALVVVPHGSDLALLEDVRDRLDLVGVPIAGYIYNRAPIRADLVGSEGSMKDVLGSSDTDG